MCKEQMRYISRTISHAKQRACLFVAGGISKIEHSLTWQEDKDGSILMAGVNEGNQVFQQVEVNAALIQPGQIALG